MDYLLGIFRAKRMVAVAALLLTSISVASAVPTINWVTINFAGEITSFSSNLGYGPSFSPGDYVTGFVSFPENDPFHTYAASISLTVNGYGFYTADPFTYTAFINSTEFSCNIINGSGGSPFGGNGAGFELDGGASGSFVTGMGLFHFSGSRPGGYFSLMGSITTVPDTGSTAQLLCLSASALFGAHRLRARCAKARR